MSGRQPRDGKRSRRGNRSRSEWSYAEPTADERAVTVRPIDAGGYADEPPPRPRSYADEPVYSRGYADERPASRGYADERPASRGYPDERPPARGYPDESIYRRGYAEEPAPSPGYADERPASRGYPDERPPARGYPDESIYQRGYAEEPARPRGYADEPTGSHAHVAPPARTRGYPDESAYSRGYGEEPTGSRGYVEEPTGSRGYVEEPTRSRGYVEEPTRPRGRPDGGRPERVGGARSDGGRPERDRSGGGRTQTAPRPAVAPPIVPARRGPTGGRLIMVLFWLGLVASVLPWWLETPTGSLRGTAASLTAAGRITGLLSGYLLIMQVLMLSRLRVLERWIGAERLIRWHRDLGATVLVAVLAHLSLIVVGYAQLGKISILGQAWVLLRDYDDMLSAYGAAGIIVVLGLTGIRAVRRALPYELWYYLHLTSYAVLLLGFGHQFSSGQQLFRPGPVRTGWIALYVLVAAAVLWGRVIAPLRLNLRHRLRVADVVAENPNTVSIYLTGRHLDRLDLLGGQFFRWRFLAQGCWWQSHPFSLSAAQNGRWLRITVKVVGEHTADLRDLEPGTPAWVSGPSGTFTAAHRRRERALLIAGGSGITPIRAVLEELPPGAALIYRASTPADVLLSQELDWLAQARDMDLWYVIGSRQDPGPRQVLSPRGLRQLVPDIGERDVYLCGPAGLIEESVAVLRKAGVPRRQIHLATFEF